MIRSVAFITLLLVGLWAGESMAQTQFFCQAGGKCTSTVATAAPTATVFSSVLAAPSVNQPRFSCTVTNIGSTQGYCQFKPSGFTPSTANSIPVPAGGGQFFCGAGNSPAIPQDEVDCTCASGTCAFVVNSNGQ